MNRLKGRVEWHGPAQGAKHHDSHGPVPTIRIKSTGLAISSEAYRQMGEPSHVLLGMTPPNLLLIKVVPEDEEGAWLCTRTGYWKGRMVGGKRTLPWIRSVYPYVKDGSVYEMEWEDDFDCWAVDLKLPLNAEGEDE